MRLVTPGLESIGKLPMQKRRQSVDHVIHSIIQAVNCRALSLWRDKLGPYNATLDKLLKTLQEAESDKVISKGVFEFIGTFKHAVMVLVFVLGAAISTRANTRFIACN